MSSKKMGVVQLTMLTGINMMGSGIILLPAKLAEVGTISILSWLVTAVGAMALAYCFAQCGMISRRPAGMFGYAEYLLGKSGNFMCNYVYNISLLVSCIAIAITAVGYGAVFFGVELSPIGVVLSTVGVLWLTMFANMGGARITGQIGGITIWGVIAPVMALCIVGWFWFKPSLYLAAWNPHNLPTFTAINSSISITLWAFLGLESACANADEVENPTKNVPIAVLGGTLGAAVIYIISTNIIAGIVPNLELASSNAPFGLAFSYMFTPTVGKIVMALMCISCIGSLLGWQFTYAVVCKSGAEAGFYPKIFTVINKLGAPVKGMLILLALETVVTFMTISPTLSKQFDVLLNMAVLTNIIPYVLSMAAILVMQRLANVNSEKVKMTAIITTFATAYTFYAIYNTGAEALIWGGMATFFGWTLYGMIAPRFELERNIRDIEEIQRTAED